MENNKLIAKFMGEKEVCTGMYRLEQHKYLKRIPYEYGCEEVCDFELSEMKYHSSWDWLMPVIEKINRDTDCYVFAEDYGTNINYAYQEAVKSIKKYNKQKR